MAFINTVDNLAYVKQHRLWRLAEYLAHGIMTTLPPNPPKFVLEEIAVIEEMMDGILWQLPENLEPPSQKVARDSKAYAQRYGIASLINDWLRAVLDAKPANPLEFTKEYFRQKVGEEELTEEEKAQQELEEDQAFKDQIKAEVRGKHGIPAEDFSLMD